MQLRTEFSLLLALLACSLVQAAAPSTSFETNRACSTFSVMGSGGRTTLRDSSAQTTTMIEARNSAPLTLTSTTTLPAPTTLSVTFKTTTRTVLADAETDVVTLTNTKLVGYVPSTTVTAPTVTPTTTSTTTTVQTVTEPTVTVYTGNYAQPVLSNPSPPRRGLEERDDDEMPVVAARDVFHRGLEARAIPTSIKASDPKEYKRTGVRCRNNVTKHIVSTRAGSPRATVTRTVTQTPATVTNTLTVPVTKIKTKFPADVTNTVIAPDTVTSTVTGKTRTDTTTPTAATVTNTATQTDTATLYPTATLAAVCDPESQDRVQQKKVVFVGGLQMGTPLPGALDENLCCDAAAQVSGAVNYLWDESSAIKTCAVVTANPPQKDVCLASSPSAIVYYTGDGDKNAGLLQCGANFQQYFAPSG
ncbi:unnamed protein product [Parajaminaea phylloscopi]